MIGVTLPGERYQGLLALAAPALREHGPGGLSTTPTISKAESDNCMLAWFQVLRQARTAVEARIQDIPSPARRIYAAGKRRWWQG